MGVPSNWDELSADEQRAYLQAVGDAAELSRQSRGLQYEHDLANDVFELSDGKIIPLRSGWSGNQSLPSPDLLIPFGGVLVALEVKTTKTNSIILQHPDNDEDYDLKDIRYWTLRMSEVPVVPAVGIKFTGSSSRLLYVARLHRMSNMDACFEDQVEQCPFDAKITRTGNLSFQKPGLDQWSSTRGGDGPTGKKDAYALLETLREWDLEEPSVLEIIRQRDEYRGQLDEGE